MAAQFDAYHKWLGIPPKDQPPNHYRLLGLTEFTNDPAVIQSAADRQIAHLQTIPPTADCADVLRQVMQQVKAAELCLLDAGHKAAYDQQLKSQRAARSGIRKAKPLATAKPLEETPRAVRATNIPIGTAVTQGSAISPLQVESDQSLASRHKKKIQFIPLLITLGVASVIPLLGLVYLLVAGNSDDNVAEAPPETPAASPESPPDSPAPQPDEAPIPTPQLPPGQQGSEDNLTTTANNDPATGIPPTDPNSAKSDPAAADSGRTTPSSEPPPDKVTPTKPDTIALPENDDRLAVPDGANKQEAMEVIHEVFDEDLSSAATPGAKRTIASQAIEATKTIDDEGAEFALLEFARDRAVEAGDIQLALQAVDQLSERFRVDTLKMKSDALVRAAPTTDTADQQNAFVEAAKPLIEEAVAAKRRQTAVNLADAALEVAKKTGEYNLAKQILDLKKEIEAKLGTP